MLKYEDVISIVEHRVPYFPNNDLNMLSNDIINYYHKYGIFILADFFTYIKDNEKEKEVLNDIINIELNNKSFAKEENEIAQAKADLQKLEAVDFATEKAQIVEALQKTLDAGVESEKVRKEIIKTLKRLN